MLYAQSFHGFETILLGLLILVTAFLLRRTVRLSSRSRDRDIVAEVQDHVRAAEDSQLAYFRKLEIRLHDLAREVEGRAQTRMHILEQLITDADQRINELRQTLGATCGQSVTSAQQGNVAVPRPLACETDADGRDAVSGTAPARAQILNLAQAGFRAAEIARCVNCSEQEVQNTLELKL